jgi:hypothetical protein
MAAQVEVDLLVSDDDDGDYVEVLTGTHTTSDGLVLPSLRDYQSLYTAISRPASGRIERRRPRRAVNNHSQYENLRRLANPRLYGSGTPPPPPAQTDVIDLTEEPDSPVETRAPPPAAAPSVGRNPRRTNSQRLSTPRLARSDSTFMAPPPAPDVIDLTDDSPPADEEEVLFRGLHRVPRMRDQLLELHIDQGQHQAASFARGFRRQLADMLSNNLFRNAFMTPHLDVTRTVYPPRQPSPKPPMEPVPPAREGFTRDTRAEPEEGDTTVVVCPACQEELAYDPAGPAVAGSGKKRRRAPGEHHFWAVKKCGHVYCADCFENRRPTKNNSGAGFPTPLNGQPADIHCAVDGCETKVGAKTEWVGIFL